MHLDEIGLSNNKSEQQNGTHLGFTVYEQTLMVPL